MDRNRLLLLMFLGLVLWRFLWIATYVHPYADDWSYTVVSLQDPLWQRLITEYHHWNGRWFSNVWIMLNPMKAGLSPGLFMYRMVPVVLILLTFLGAHALWRALWRDRTTPIDGVLASLLFVVVYLGVMPQLSEGIYWYTGAVTYQLPSALLLFLAALWIRIMERDGPAAWQVMICALLTLMIAGSSETHMVLVLLFQTGIVLYHWRTSRPLGPPLLLLMIALVAAIFMITAPGNAQRLGNFPDRFQPGHTLVYSTLQTLRFLFTWTLHPLVISGSILWLIYDRKWELTKGIRVSFLLAAASIAGVVFLLMALPYWNTGILGQHRTVNVALFVFLPCWAPALSLFLRSVKRPSWLGPTDHSILPRIAWAFFGITAMGWGTGYALNKDLLQGNLVHYDELMMVRYAALVTAIGEGAGELHLPPIVPMPESLLILDAGADPTHWGNSSLAAYFGGEPFTLIIEQDQALQRGPGFNDPGHDR